MSQAAAVPAVTWPHLQFGPVNLWSLPADWKRDPQIARPVPAIAPRSSSSQVNPHIRRILANR